MNPSDLPPVKVLCLDKEGRWQLVGPEELVSSANRFLARVAARGLRPGTLRTYAFDMRCICEWATRKSIRPQEIGPEALLDFIEYLQGPPAQAPSTINRRLSLLQRWVRVLTGDAIALPNWPTSGLSLRRTRPAQRVIRVKEPHRLVRPLREGEALAFYEHLCTWRDRAITLLMWMAGLRSVEVLNLTLPDVDFERMSMRLLGKGAKPRIMPLHESIASALLHYLKFERPPTSRSTMFLVLKGPTRGHPMTSATLRRIFRYHRQTSGVARANAHRFRHTFGANMTRANTPLLVLAKMMGHASPKTTMTYVTLEDPEVREIYQQALNKLYPPLTDEPNV